MTATNVIKHRRRLGSLPFNGGNRQTMPIDLVGPLLELNVRLRYTVTNSAVAPVGTLFQNQAGIAKRMEVIAQGRDTVWSVSGPLMAARHQYEHYGASWRGMETAIALGANAVTNVDIVMTLRFDLPHGKRSDDTALDLRGLSLCQFAMTWGTAADLFTTPNGAVISNQQVDVEGVYLINVDPKQVYAVRSLDELNQPLTATNSNYTLDIDARTGIAVRTLGLFTLTGTIGDDTVLQNGSIRVEGGAQQFINTQTPLLKATVRKDLSLLPAQEIVGFNYIDFQYNDQLVNAIPTGALDANLKMFLDATYPGSPCNVIVQREIVRPLKIS